MMKNIYLKIMSFVDKKNNPVFKLSVSEQTNFINSIGLPIDNVERSFCQYKCQQHIYGCIYSFLINIICFPVLFGFLLYLLIKRKDDNCLNKCDCVLYINNIPIEKLPDSIKMKYKKIERWSKEKKRINSDDIKSVLYIWKKHPFSYYFIFKILYKISIYRAIVDETRPDAIVCSCEYSFTSSILTEWCNNNCIKHLNIMHGEKYYCIRDSFCCFDEFYVWDSYYKDILSDLKMESMFIIEKPKALLFNVQRDIKYDYKYYLQRNTIYELETINKIMNTLKTRGYSVCVRPHPVYSNLEEIKKIFTDIDIEYTDYISIEQSIAETANVVGLFSTVLYQAYCNNIDVYLDDISNVDYYKKLKDIKYIMINKKHYLLSEIVR